MHSLHKLPINSPKPKPYPTLSLSIVQSLTKKRRRCITATYVYVQRRGMITTAASSENLSIITDGSFFTAKAMANIVHVALLAAQPLLHTNVP